LFKPSPQQGKDNGYLQKAIHLICLDILDWDELSSEGKNACLSPVVS